MFERLSKNLMVACCALAIGACSDDSSGGGSGGSSGSGGAGGSGGSSSGTTVAVTVEEFSVSAAPASAKSGAVTFEVTNNGAEDHEFVVIKTDLPPAQLPIADHMVDETAPGVAKIDEIETITPGSMAELKVNLASGKYVLICNRVETETDGGMESHYAEGMYTPFMVE